MASTTFVDVICSGCGCLCDDVSLEADGDAISTARLSCHLGQQYLSHSTVANGPVAEVDGVSVSLDVAIARTAEILEFSRAPLISGFATSSVESQRCGIGLAERLRATFDPALEDFHRATLVALQSVGLSTCTLGEIRHRADVVLFWGCNPTETHPRLWERFIDPPGRFVPAGRSGRYVVVLSANRSPTADIADEFIQVESENDLGLLATLRGLVQGTTRGSGSNPLLEQRQSLVARLKSAQYAVIFFGSELAAHDRASANLESLFLLVRELNSTGRCVAVGLGGLLAENVLTWQTGYPCGVSFADGHPRYEPLAYAAARLVERNEVDAVLTVGNGVSHLTARAVASLKSLPWAALVASHESLPFTPTVRINIGHPAFHTAGTLFRMDGVPLRTQPVTFTHLPSDTDVLTQISERVTSQCI